VSLIFLSWRFDHGDALVSVIGGDWTGRVLGVGFVGHAEGEVADGILLRFVVLLAGIIIKLLVGKACSLVV